ncbi:hypothetical protein [Caballeronia mineralivorans]|jgi:hypothetical protein|uniref:hypothetical protein n=1 Tax=Caballeronia mineralivorans TaxID=2010198 RepID=UPI0023F27B80|nr:hypothetical protein [Caballeronia mineralivorans]MDB5786403.1 hypothetical protein [Caballeronia mineralivorans]
MPNFYLVRRCLMAAGLLVVCTARTQTASACPDWVTTPAGSAFNIAALIADNGSPQAALEKVRDSLSRVVKGGGCGTFVEPAACDETVELAKKAIKELERCAPASGPTNPKKGESPSLETENG